MADAAVVVALPHATARGVGDAMDHSKDPTTPVVDTTNGVTGVLVDTKTGGETLGVAATNPMEGSMPPQHDQSDGHGVAAGPSGVCIADPPIEAQEPHDASPLTDPRATPAPLPMPAAPPSDIPPTRPIIKQVRFADERPPASILGRKSSTLASRRRPFPFRKVVVAAPMPLTDAEAMAVEMALVLPTGQPEFTWVEQLKLGITWTKEVKSMRVNNQESLRWTKRRRMSLTPKQWAMVLSFGLAFNTTVVDLDVQDTALGNLGAIALFQTLRVNRTLLRLNVASNQIGDDAAYALAALLQTNTTLTQLVLHDNGFTARGIAVLGAALGDSQDSSLLDLDLSFNPLDEASSLALSTCLQVNETLTRLNLAGTRVHEATVLASLRRNCTLVALQLQTVVADSNQTDGRLSRDRLNRSHAPPLMDALRRSTAALESCNLTGVALPIAKLKSSRWVHLPASRLNELDGLVLSALLPMNQHLLELDVSGNALRSESVVAIVAAIIDCPRLKTVDVHDNDLTDVIGEALGLALVNNTTLETIRVADCVHDVQLLRGSNAGVSEYLTFEKGTFGHALDKWIVAVLMRVNRTTLVLNDLHVPSRDTHLDLCHLTLEDYEAVYVSTRVRHHVYMTHLFINSSNLNYYAGMRLADALRNHPILQSVSLEHNNLNQLGGKAIAECMEHNPAITYLNLSWNHLADVGVLPFATSLKANRSLKRLDLRGNEIGATGIAAIGDGLRGNACLEELYLRWNDIGTNAASALAAALCVNKTLAVLDIEQHHMEMAGAVAIADMLRVNTSLKTLDMKGDLMLYPTASLGVAGARTLAEALRDHNHTLTELNVSENRFGQEGCECLVQMMASTHLRKLDLSYAELDGETSLVLFAQLAHNKTVVALNVAHNTVGADGIKGVVRCLCVNKTLEELDLSFNQITEEGMLLLEFHAKQFALLRVRLGGNRITDPTRARLQSLPLTLVIDI
ncbi:Aste57867_20156 [Aphanomyces stellatus]|uniref:Aste57867_20156 protein n=1 Tax=Aphanomyces stellatus TaxID=120398 RepID=A0A485LFJ2_9STRA|nr:hypothetical protein As57867_020090 [Aphanomyces stellatus]VFT96851.1 Aste57867_20156 [Aphanomyces stellatus]